MFGLGMFSADGTITMQDARHPNHGTCAYMPRILQKRSIDADAASTCLAQRGRPAASG